VEITTLGYYCNALENEAHRKNLEKAIDNARLYGAKTVSTFAGALEGRSVDEALPRFGEVFRELAKRAEDQGVRLAIENCPMGGTWDRATCNIGFNPRAWERMFDEVTSPRAGPRMGARPSDDSADRPHRPAAQVGGEDLPPCMARTRPSTAGRSRTTASFAIPTGTPRSAPPALATATGGT
jgi:hypothetical protein